VRFSRSGSWNLGVGGACGWGERRELSRIRSRSIGVEVTGRGNQNSIAVKMTRRSASTCGMCMCERGKDRAKFLSVLGLVVISLALYSRSCGWIRHNTSALVRYFSRMTCQVLLPRRQRVNPKNYSCLKLLSAHLNVIVPEIIDICFPFCGQLHLKFISPYPGTPSSGKRKCGDSVLHDIYYVLRGCPSRTMATDGTNDRPTRTEVGI
jgi:hypothetical protein